MPPRFERLRKRPSRAGRRIGAQTKNSVKEYFQKFLTARPSEEAYRRFLLGTGIRVGAEVLRGPGGGEASVRGVSA